MFGDRAVASLTSASPHAASSRHVSQLRVNAVTRRAAMCFRGGDRRGTAARTVFAPSTCQLCQAFGNK